MKVLFIIETCGGGSGRHLLDLAGGLRSLEHEVHVIYSPLRAEASFLQDLRNLQGVRRYPIRMQTRPGIDDLHAVVQLRRYIKRMGPFDVIHGHSSKGGALGRLAAARHTGARVYTPHALYTMNPNLSGVKQHLYGTIERVLAHLVTDAVILVSQEECDHALDQGIPVEKADVVVNAVDFRKSSELQAHRQRIRQRLGVSPSTVVSGFVGRLDQQRAPERFIELARRMRHHPVDCHFVMLGSGEKEKEIRELIAQYNLESSVSLFHNQSGEAFMPAFDLFLLTSRYEAMPYVLIEALAAHLPIISTDVGGAHTVITEGVNGHIVPESDNLDDLEHHLLRLCQEPDRRQRYQEAAALKAGEFSLKTMITNTCKVYQKAQASQPLRRGRS